MDYEEQDVEVIRMLSKLKETGSTYPVEMMASRRQSYVKQIAALGIGTGAALAIKEGAKAAGGSSLPPIATTIVEAALIVAIVAEASFVAFMNREKVLDLYQKISGQSTVQEVNDVPDSSRPLLAPTESFATALMVTEEPTLEPTLMTETATVAETPSPETVVVTDPGSTAGDDISSVEVNSTPAPNGNNGNHYGQTPIPERTKDNGNNGGGSNSNNNDSNGDDNGGNNGNNNNNRNNR